jgi:SAM-dependent MidA family methyltransferase
LKCIDEPGRRAAPSPNDFPVPSPEAQAHSEALIVRLAEAIAAGGGSIPFAQYMNLALYAPGLGYYSAGSRKFGAEGDFVTAPEVSPLFSQCLSRQCAQVLAEVGGDILEFGAGTGTMAADILLQLERMEALPPHYLILELSAELQQRQRRTLEQKAPHLLGRVQWLEQLPASFRGVVLANEVLDAMPVHRVLHRDGQWQELAVGWDGQRFCWQAVPLQDSAVAARLKGLDNLPEPYTTEVCTHADAWIAQLGDMLQAGLILLIDYGFPRHEYYHPERSQGTLMCHYRHRAHDDPFVYPGLQDITAHVDFTAVAEAALPAGLSVYGYTSQAIFLLATGLEQAMEGVEDAEQQYRLAQQIKTLTLPSEMGELFKVMALGKGLAETELMGFALNDMRGKL